MFCTHIVLIVNLSPGATGHVMRQYGNDATVRCSKAVNVLGTVLFRCTNIFSKKMAEKKYLTLAEFHNYKLDTSKVSGTIA